MALGLSWPRFHALLFFDRYITIFELGNILLFWEIFFFIEKYISVLGNLLLFWEIYFASTLASHLSNGTHNTCTYHFTLSIINYLFIKLL